MCEEREGIRIMQDLLTIPTLLALSVGYPQGYLSFRLSHLDNIIQHSLGPVMLLFTINL